MKVFTEEAKRLKVFSRGRLFKVENCKKRGEYVYVGDVVHLNRTNWTVASVMLDSVDGAVGQ